MRVVIGCEPECVTFLHRVTRYEIDAVDNAFSCDLFNSGQRLLIRPVFAGEYVTFFEFHMMSL
jgi:hypothetical protein